MVCLRIRRVARRLGSGTAWLRVLHVRKNWAGELSVVRLLFTNEGSSRTVVLNNAGRVPIR